MEQKDRYIRFDWAAKRLLRNKANFGVLEGFLTVLLGENIRILEILESESNQLSPEDKFNRVDIKARNSKDEIIIVEYPRDLLSGTYPLRSGQNHHRAYRTGTHLLGCQKGIFHQYPLL